MRVLRYIACLLIFVLPMSSAVGSLQSVEEFEIWTDTGGNSHIRKGEDKYHCCNCFRVTAYKLVLETGLVHFFNAEGIEVGLPVPLERVYGSKGAEEIWYCPEVDGEGWADNIPPCGLIPGST